MVKPLASNDLATMMKRTDQIRNISLVGYMAQGKSTMMDFLRESADGISPIVESKLREPTTMNSDEADHPITITSTGSYFQFKDHLMSIIDTPGHIDYASEVTAALRISDGAVVVVDCLDGFSINTEMAIRQAILENIKFVLAINKFDLFFLETRNDGEEVLREHVKGKGVYDILDNIIRNANAVSRAYNYPHGKVNPCVDVVFCCMKDGWSFKFWDFAPNQAWCETSFVNECFNPIKSIIKYAFMVGEESQELRRQMLKLGVHLKDDELNFRKRVFIQTVMKKWSPDNSSLLNIMISCLPSPSAAQQYRQRNLYDHNDVYATAIENCDPKGPLIVYVSKLLPSSVKGIFFALGRVFAGTAVKGLKVKILESGKEGSIQLGCNVQAVECGNIISLIGFENLIYKNGTLVTTEIQNKLTRPMCPMKFCTSLVFRVSVKWRNSPPGNSRSMFADCLKELNHLDPMIVCTMGKNKNTLFIDCVGDFHASQSVKYIVEYIPENEILVSDRFVIYRETVSEETPVPTTPPIRMSATSLINHGMHCFGPEKKRSLFIGKAKEVDDEIIMPNLEKCLSSVRGKGVLAEENLMGICFKVFEVDPNVSAQISPQDCETIILKSQAAAKPRLLEPFYRLKVSVTELNKRHVYTIINNIIRRRGVEKFRGEEFHVPGVPFHHVYAYIRAEESVGLARDLRTIGKAASSQCVLHHWKVIEEDPFEGGSRASEIVRKIREFKGLAPL